MVPRDRGAASNPLRGFPSPGFLRHSRSDSSSPAGPCRSVAAVYMPPWFHSAVGHNQSVTPPASTVWRGSFMLALGMTSSLGKEEGYRDEREVCSDREKCWTAVAQSWGSDSSAGSSRAPACAQDPVAVASGKRGVPQGVTIKIKSRRRKARKHLAQGL